MICVLMGSLVGCNKTENTENVTNDKPVEVLLITDYGTVSDGSFNQGVWEGICNYADDTGTLVDYYRPANTDKDSYLQEIKRGVKNGAKVIVCPGYMLEETVYEAQKSYPEVNFILVDGTPHNADYTDETIEKNVCPVLFAEEQAGFLAGYAAVRDGYTGLGFIGGIAEDPVIRYGYGFVQGADYAAIEMGVEVHVRYTYANTFDDTPLVETTASTWFDDDTQVIFACGGSLGKGVMKAAEEHNGKVIGVDVDQSTDSETVITSAMKSLSGAVYQTLDDYGQGRFGGGVAKIITAADSGVCLPMDTSRFERFTAVDYESVYSRLVDGMINPYNGCDVGTTQELTLINTNVTYIVME